MTTKPETRRFQAHATGVRSCYADTPRGAALNFFNAHPTKKKCAIIEGWDDGQSFVVKFCASAWPKSWKDVTKKTAADLPDTLTGEA